MASLHSVVRRIPNRLRDEHLAVGGDEGSGGALRRAEDDANGSLTRGRPMSAPEKKWEKQPGLLDYAKRGTIKEVEAKESKRRSKKSFEAGVNVTVGECFSKRTLHSQRNQGGGGEGVLNLPPPRH